MTQFANKRFSVSQSGRSPEDCGHGWTNEDNSCVFCGTIVCGDVWRDGSICKRLPGHRAMHEAEDGRRWGSVAAFDEEHGILPEVFPSPPEPSE